MTWAFFVLKEHHTLRDERTCVLQERMSHHAPAVLFHHRSVLQAFIMLTTAQHAPLANFVIVVRFRETVQQEHFANMVATLRIHLVITHPGVPSVHQAFGAQKGLS